VLKSTVNIIGCRRLRWCEEQCGIVNKDGKKWFIHHLVCSLQLPNTRCRYHLATSAQFYNFILYPLSSAIKQSHRRSSVSIRTFLQGQKLGKLPSPLSFSASATQHLTFYPLTSSQCQTTFKCQTWSPESLTRHSPL
jgi:hypothetical protein